MYCASIHENILDFKKRVIFRVIPTAKYRFNRTAVKRSYWITWYLAHSRIIPIFRFKLLIMAQSFYWRLSNALHFARLISLIASLPTYVYQLKTFIQIPNATKAKISIFESFGLLIKKEYIAAIITIIAIFRKLLKFASPSISKACSANIEKNERRVRLTSPRCRLVVSLVRICQARSYPCSEVRPRWIPNWFLPVCTTRKT